MSTFKIGIEWDEDGARLSATHVDDERIRYVFLLDDPEQAYDTVKAAILPWLMERDEARLEVERGVPEIHVPAESANEFALFRSVFECDPDESAGAYDISDPKHPDWHSVHADIWDAREGK